MSQPNSCTGACKTALIALGANATSAFGSPYKTIRQALIRLPFDSLTIGKISRFFTSPAFPAGAGPDFVNAAIEVKTDITPGELLSHLHAVESDLGRIRKDRWGPRVIDLDLIDYASEVIPDAAEVQRWLDLPLEAQKQTAPDHLVLPHPRLQDRAFVLGPICDIAPDWVHPILGQSAQMMFDALPDADKAALVPFDPAEDAAAISPET